jgi:hypothetical protein
MRPPPRPARLPVGAREIAAQPALLAVSRGQRALGAAAAPTFPSRHTPAKARVR